jgi:hypothetical protein
MPDSEPVAQVKAPKKKEDKWAHPSKEWVNKVAIWEIWPPITTLLIYHKLIQVIRAITLIDSLPAASERNDKTSLVASVFPAPDSPLMRID